MNIFKQRIIVFQIFIALWTLMSLFESCGQEYMKLYLKMPQNVSEMEGETIELFQISTVLKIY